MKMNINEGLPQICFLQQAHLDFPRNGGDKRDRTADLLNAIQALSQLSYTPTAAQVQRNNCGVLTGIRTPVPTVKGSCPRPLDDEDNLRNPVKKPSF